MIKIEDIIIRLEVLGYKYNDEDSNAINTAAESTEQYIKNYCNISEIPKELYSTAVDMAAGTLLKTKLSTGCEVCSGIDLDSDGIKGITEGDISVTYSESGGSVNRYAKLIDSLLSRKSELIKYRKLRW